MIALWLLTGVVAAQPDVAPEGQQGGGHALRAHYYRRQREHELERLASAARDAAQRKNARAQAIAKAERLARQAAKRAEDDERAELEAIADEIASMRARVCVRSFS